VVVFVSPIPALLLILAQRDGERFGSGANDGLSCVQVFHNNKREKKELPNGKIISVTATEGWELI
jgi:hypothetical protein